MNQKVDGERMKKGYKEKRFAIGVIYHTVSYTHLTLPTKLEV